MKKLTLGIFLLALVFLPGLGRAQICYDFICEAPEDEYNCPEDCSYDFDQDGMPTWWEAIYVYKYPSLYSGPDCSISSCCVDPMFPDALSVYDDDFLESIFEYACNLDPCNWDTDGDGMDDGWDYYYFDECYPECCPLYPFCCTPYPECCTLNPNGQEDPDSDGLTNLEEYYNSTNPLDPDSDNDLMFDGWEINAASCGLDPLFFGDAWLDGDTDGLANIHEYFNNNGDGNVSDPCDENKPRRGWPGGGYFGDADGNLLIGVPDLNKINIKLNDRLPDYSNVFPADPIIQDLDGNQIIGVPDKDLISLILNGKQSGIIAGSPTELSLVAPIGGATVSEGDTVRIQVKLTKDLTKPRAGFGVVFTIVSGSGTLLGGEGISGSGRYDLTALDGVAQLVVRVDGTESILVEVALPYDPEVHTQALALTPDPTVQINVEQP